MATIGFGEWQPDMPAYAGNQLQGGVVPLRDARGVYYDEGGYRPIRKPGGASYGTLTGDTPVTAATFFGTTIDNQIVVGSQTKLYQVSGSSFVDASKQVSLTAVADNGSSQPRFTSTAHGLDDGVTVTIAGTVNYNGDKVITVIDANTFDVTADAYVAETLSGATAQLNYAAGKAAGWQMAQFGSRIIAVSINDNPQYLDIGGTRFDNLSSTAPKATCVAQVRDFVFFGDIDDGTRRKNRVRWSGFNDSTSWTIDPDATQADYQDLDASFGEVQKIIGGEFATIFQRRAITRATYVGPPAIFQFDVLEHDRGASVAGSVIAVGRNIYYLSDDGFYLFNGASSMPIGEGRINRWLSERIDDGIRQYCRAAHDKQRGLIIWTWPAAVAEDGSNGALALIYSYRQNRWSYDLQQGEQWLYFSGISDGLLLDEMIAPLDWYTDPIDSSAYDLVVERLMVMLYDGVSDWNLYRLGGSLAAVELETHQVSFSPARGSFVDGAFIVGNITSAVTAKILLDSDDDYPTRDPAAGTATTVDADGFYPVSARGRYFTFSVQTDEVAAEDLSTENDRPVIQGIDVQQRPTGRFA